LSARGVAEVLEDVLCEQRGVGCGAVKRCADLMKEIENGATLGYKLLSALKLIL